MNRNAAIVQYLRARLMAAARVAMYWLGRVVRSLWRRYRFWPRPLLYKLLIVVCFLGTVVEGPYLVVTMPTTAATSAPAPALATTPQPWSAVPVPTDSPTSSPTAVPAVPPSLTSTDIPTAAATGTTTSTDGPRAAATSASASVPAQSASVVNTEGGRFIVEPDDGVAPLVSFIRAARHALEGDIYLFSSAAVADALGDAVRRGVQVRLVLDPRPLGGPSGAAQTAYRVLTAEGVAVRWASPAYRFTHAKFLVADDASAWIGTMNWTNAAFTQNREFAQETAALIVVREAKDVFVVDWEGVPLTVAPPDLVVSPLNARATILDLITGARYSLDIYAEEVYDRAVIQALADATRRGVRVRIVYAGLGDAEGLSGIGGQVARVSAPYIHAKAIVADGIVLYIGSENLSATSLDRNREVGLLINDRLAIAEVEQAFTKDLGGGRLAPTPSGPAVATSTAEPTESSVQVVVTPAVMPYDAYPILIVRTVPGTRCAAGVTYSTGYTPVSFNGYAQTTGADGVVRWGWHEMTKGESGTADVTCTVNGTPVRGTTTFTVRH